MQSKIEEIKKLKEKVNSLKSERMSIDADIEMFTDRIKFLESEIKDEK